ncbi:hypothetical protein M427DRAFT_51335 [Gonapodya prolifera JEL478]|uniref:Uncharacterized protein n=1 Tax=Gonapodya prolifera (strain JEL478) TaxID=1344416 RepID=A0A139AZ17_GONPJ|nr:hypothetical protein M427DRAFT_51335 [Gonapodya prolifera JEL478]|eukprot:KXS21969.1 hypothetical protein M427DRAFT_51335 [Gonapodya prolifera JEL478]
MLTDPLHSFQPHVHPFFTCAACAAPAKVELPLAALGPPTFRVPLPGVGVLPSSPSSLLNTARSPVAGPCTPATPVLCTTASDTLPTNPPPRLGLGLGVPPRVGLPPSCSPSTLSGGNTATTTPVRTVIPSADPADPPDAALDCDTDDRTEDTDDATDEAPPHRRGLGRGVSGFAGGDGEAGGCPCGGPGDRAADAEVDDPECLLYPAAS